MIDPTLMESQNDEQIILTAEIVIRRKEKTNHDRAHDMFHDNFSPPSSFLSNVIFGRVFLMFAPEVSVFMCAMPTFSFSSVSWRHEGGRRTPLTDLFI